MPTLLHGPGCNSGSGRGCPLVVHCLADLQSVHELRCYGNMTRTLSVSEYMIYAYFTIVKFLSFLFNVLPFMVNKCVYSITTATAIYSLRYWLQIRTAVPRSS